MPKTVTRLYNGRKRGRFVRRILLISALCGSMAAGPLAAAQTKDTKSGGGQYVDMAPVALPIVSQGRLVNYVFVTLRLILRPGAVTTRMREKEPYFRDALVRLSARTPLNRPDDLTRVDERLVRSDMMAMSGPIVGPGMVTSVVVVHQAPQHRIGLQTPLTTGGVEP